MEHITHDMDTCTLYRKENDKGSILMDSIVVSFLGMNYRNFVIIVVNLAEN